MAHITITQLNTILSRIVAWVTGKFAAKNATSGKLEYTDMPVVVLASMGAELDGTGTERPMSPGSTYFLPAEQGVGARIMFVTSDNRPVKISDPVSGVIYCNAYTDLFYRWDAAESEMVPVGGTSSGSIDISGKADLLAGTNMLHPNQWPKSVLRNVTDATIDDLSIGDVYFDTGKLWYYKTPSSVDMGTPSNKVIYYCLADGKFYRWTGSAFTQIAAGGGAGTVTGVKMNNGSPIAPDSNGVVDLGTVITQHQDISGKVDKVTGKGLSTNDYTDADKNKLAGLPTGYDLSDTLDEIESGIPTKTSELTNDSGFVTASSIPDTSTLATKSEVTQGLAGKQDTLTFDNTPTANSNNPVKSGGIYTALQTLLSNITIDANGYWKIGNTTTNVPAKGDAGNVSITDAGDLVTILVNDLVTGGSGYLLSAEMGKKLRVKVDALNTKVNDLINALATIAFTNGKPYAGQISWGDAGVVHHTVTLDTTNLDNCAVVETFPKSVADGDGATITIVPISNKVILSASYKIGASGTPVNVSIADNQAVITLSNITDDITVYLTASAVASLSAGTMFTGVRYENKSNGAAYLHVGNLETYLLSPLIDLGARSTSKDVTFSTGATGIDGRYGLIEFGANGNFIGFWSQQASLERTVSCGASVRYVRVQTTPSNLSGAYIKDGSTYLFNGSEQISSNAGDADAFLASDYCPATLIPNSNGDYEGCLPCAPNVDMDLNNADGSLTGTKDQSKNNAIGDTALKAQMSLVTAVGTQTRLPWVVGAVTELPNDKKFKCSAGEKSAGSDVCLPTIQLYTKSNGVVTAYGYAGLYSSTDANGERIFTTSSRTHANIVCSQSMYDSDSHGTYIKATTSGTVLWGNEYARTH